MPVYTLPPTPSLRPAPLDATDLAGEDLAVRRGLEVAANGDWLTVRYEEASIQSVRREHLANPSALARRPEWGVGLPSMLFKSNSRATRDEMITRSRRRLTANPRVAKTLDVKTQALTGVSGTALVVEFVPVGTQKPAVTIIKPGDK